MSNGWVRISFSAPIRYGEAAAEFLQRALQRLQVGVQRAAGLRQVLVGGLAEPSHRIDGVDQQVLGVGEMLDQRRDVGQHPVEDVRSGLPT